MFRTVAMHVSHKISSTFPKCQFLPFISFKKDISAPLSLPREWISKKVFFFYFLNYFPLIEYSGSSSLLGWTIFENSMLATSPYPYTLSLECIKDRCRFLNVSICVRFNRAKRAREWRTVEIIFIRKQKWIISSD